MQNKSHIKKGLTVAAILIIFNIITQFTKTNFDEWTTFVFAAIIVIGVALSNFLYGKESNENLTFSTLFGYGFKTAAVIACIYFVYTILAVYVFFPGFVEEKLRRGIEEAKKQGAFDQKNMKENPQALEGIGRKVIVYTHFAGSIMGTLFLGVIGSLVGAVTANKKTQQQN